MLFRGVQKKAAVTLASIVLAALTCSQAWSGAGQAVNIPGVEKDPQRVWQLNDPLYKELLSGTPPGDQRYGAIYWGHTYAPSLLQPFAKEYGFRYSSEEALKELADSKLLMIPWPVRPNSILGDPFLMKMADKYHFKLLFYPDLVTIVTPDLPKEYSSPLMLDPRSREYYFKDLKDTLQKGRKYIWGVYTGDELVEQNMNLALDLFWKHSKEYPYILQIDRMVKKECGFGKYGLPESKDDLNPCRWYAARTWVNNYFINMQKDVYQTVKSIAPEVRVISIDPTAGYNQVGFDRSAPYFDIATQQLYPPRDPNRQQFGFTTKMVSDFTGKPTWTCTHVEYYPYSTNLQEVRELMSEVMRNGGTGFHFWLKDEVGNNADHGFLYSTKWGFPERWRAITEINTLNSRMNEVNVPKDPDFAIFHSEDYANSYMQDVWTWSNESEWAYTFFGPVARTWFKFVNDNMVQDKTIDLSRFKAVIVPGAKCERASVVNGLADYVSSGGTLVVGDPQAFTTDVNGEPLTEIREKLIGSSIMPSENQTSLKFGSNCSMPYLRNRTLPVTGPAFTMKPRTDSEIMATFTDGSPAVWLNKIGKGRVIVFASNPFTISGIADQSWKDFFKALCKDLGLQADRAIWRFQFPAYKTVEQPAPEGVCLTGNYVTWWRDEPAYVQNELIPGTYSYNQQPDLIADRGDSKIPFAAGKLTDRKAAYTTLKKDLKPEDFTVGWKNEKPVDIIFDLLEPRTTSRVHLWYSGQLPALKIQGSVDGKKWSQLASHRKQSRISQGAGLEDVLDVALDLPSGSNVRYIRLSLAARKPGVPMTLVECEVWGNAASKQ